MDAPIEGTDSGGGDDKQQRLIDLYEDPQQQTALEAYAEGAIARPGEWWKVADTGAMAKALNYSQRFVFENWTMSGKELAASLGVSEPRVSQLRSETIAALQDKQNQK